MEIKPTSLILQWTKAADNGDAALLQYIIYYSESNNIGTVEDAEAYGTAFGNYEMDVSAGEITDLMESFVYGRSRLYTR